MGGYRQRFERPTGMADETVKRNAVRLIVGRANLMIRVVMRNEPIPIGIVVRIEAVGTSEGPKGHEEKCRHEARRTPHTIEHHLRGTPTARGRMQF